MKEGVKVNENQIKEMKELYPKGTRIELGHMDDPCHPVPDGTLGTVDHVDDAGQIHMKWDNGRSLAIVPEVDDFSIVDKIKVIVVEPDKHPEVKDISNDLKTMQSIVDGHIEEVFLDDDTVLICNEEGKLMDLKANRSVGNDIIAGTFFIAGDDGGDELVSLNEEQIKEYTDKFYEIEEHSQEEIHGKIGYKVYGY